MGHLPDAEHAGYGSSCGGGGPTPTRRPPTASSWRWLGCYSVNIPVLLRRCVKDSPKRRR